MGFINGDQEHVDGHQTWSDNVIASYIIPGNGKKYKLISKYLINFIILIWLKFARYIYNQFFPRHLHAKFHMTSNRSVGKIKTVIFSQDFACWKSWRAKYSLFQFSQQNFTRDQCQVVEKVLRPMAIDYSDYDDCTVGAELYQQSSIQSLNLCKQKPSEFGKLLQTELLYEWNYTITSTRELYYKDFSQDLYEQNYSVQYWQMKQFMSFS